ncbi:hypothetical protein NORO109296_12635 [Nocardiopsis rhodophaea]
MIPVPGYGLFPSSDVVRLRAEFPGYLICELHDELGFPSYVATRRARAEGGQVLLITARTVANLRAEIQAQEQRQGGDA